MKPAMSKMLTQQIIVWRVSCGKPERSNRLAFDPKGSQFLKNINI